MAHIKVFARPRSDVVPSEYFIVNERNIIAQFSEVGVTGATYHPISYDFQFSHVFDRNATQEAVFKKVAVESGLLSQFTQGFNATIFAYGQTASGKSFTVEGIRNDVKKLGIAQRSISYIYQILQARKEENVEVAISYIEVYQEIAYDLLNPIHDRNGAYSFPRVAVKEGSPGMSFFQNLSCIPAPNEKIAQQLFARAVSNRQVAETSANFISSRSHGIFTIHLTTQKVNSDTKTHSKLHIVDLAGSERVSKTKASGRVLREAQSINLSLHYLEQVILALQLEQRLCGDNKAHVRKLHIPYRNSQLTMILRDSLGGNCVTAMIANLHLDTTNLGESISTCRFAQRVALVANFAKRNDHIDQRLLVRKLKARIADLEAEVRSYEGRNPPLTEQDQDLCWRIGHEFMEGKLDSVFPDHLNTWNQLHECMFNIRQMHQEQLDYITTEASNCEKCNNRQLKSVCTSFSFADSSRSRSRPTSARPPTTRRSSTRQSGSSFRAASNSQRTAQQTSSFRPNRSIEEAATSFEKSFINEDEASKQPRTPTTEEDYSDIASIYSKQGKRNGYLSPYDKATIKEIQKISKAVEKRQKEKNVKKELVKSKEAALKAQQLQLALYTLRHKAQITAEQMADQHAFVLQMKHARKRDASFDEEDIEQEKLAEFQLKKRLYKLEQKIQVVEKNMDVINTHQQSSRIGSEQGNDGGRSMSSTEKTSEKDEALISSSGSKRGNDISGKARAENPSECSDTLISPAQVQTISSKGNVRVASKTILNQLKLENELLQSTNQKLANQELVQKDAEMWLKEEQTRIKLEHMKKELRKQQQLEAASKSLQPTSSKSSTSVRSDKNGHLESPSGTLKAVNNNESVSNMGDNFARKNDEKLLNLSSSSESENFEYLRKQKESADDNQTVGVEAMSPIDREEKCNYLEHQQEIVINKLRELQRSALLGTAYAHKHESDPREGRVTENETTQSGKTTMENEMNLSADDCQNGSTGHDL